MRGRPSRRPGAGEQARREPAPRGGGALSTASPLPEPYRPGLKPAGESGPRLLILNGDDWGGDRESTDRILDCYRAQRLSSTSAMVFMGDSQRAARLATEHSLPTGLHLNLTQRFNSTLVPNEVLERQARAVRAFSRYRIHNWVLFPKRWLTYPWLRGLVDACIRDQLNEFHRLYDQPPTHLDGHHHVHLCPTVTVSDAIPVGHSIRNTHRFGVRQRLVRERFTSPDRHICMQELRPFGRSTLDERLSGADGCAVELELHPALGEHGYLMSDDWAEAIAGRPLGSFADL